MDFNARFYSPRLGRFIQPDSVIPDLTNSQAWNRYSYSYNNPINYTDPSGHVPIGDDDDICLPSQDCWEENGYGGGSGDEVGVLHDLPVDEDALEGIQPYGATVFAHGAGTLYAYCQGFHCGIDFFAAWGTPVQSGVYGEVIGIDWPYEGPYNIVIKSGDYVFKYGHLDGSEPPVSIGDWVSPDTIIGYVGNMTGDPADGNIHLHFEVRSPSWSDLTYNPETIMAQDVKQRYNDYLSNQTGYPGGKYYNSRLKFTGIRETVLPSEPWWQTPDTIRRVDDGSTLWPK